MSFSSVLNLSSLNGSNGFVINGTNENDRVGRVLSDAGDINGDGVTDLAIGVYRATANSNIFAGQTYIVFGSTNAFASNFNLSSLNGSNGFVINGINEEDRSGRAISNAGDINGDGITDLVIGAYRANSNGVLGTGQTYVVFGSSNGFTDSLNLSSLNGDNGFTINGINEKDFSGRAVSSAGDINGDDIADLVIGASAADPNGNLGAGQTYVVFGSSNGFDSSFNLSSLNGNNGFTINGINEFDGSGRSVSNAGDINGDGITDLVISASSADPNDTLGAGQTYVVFGSSNGFDSTVSLSSLNGSNGFTINGINEKDFSGISVNNAGDINGDGIADLVIGASSADPNGTLGAGQTYVVFGSSNGFDSSFNLSSLNGSNGFTINGINEFDNSGASISNAGDVNDDGLADLVIGASGVDVNDVMGVGQTYVVFGSSNGFASTLNLSTLNGSNGFTVNGINERDLSGNSVSNAGDINGDGIADLAIGARNADPNGTEFAGQTYIIFGQAASSQVINGDDQDNFLEGTAGDDTINGFAGNDTLEGLGGSDTLTGGLGSDKLSGGRKFDSLRGGRGKDNLTGGRGDDLLTGGKGSDRFSFKTPNLGIDTIKDFVVDEDNIVISASGFGGGLETGNKLKKSEFFIGESATTSQQRFIYNQTDGALLFDVDGNGSTAAIQIATLSNLAELGRADFTVI